MDEPYQTAYDILQKDSALKYLPVDVRTILSRLIESENCGGVLSLIEFILPDHPDQDALLYLKSMCHLQENNFDNAEAVARDLKNKCLVSGKADLARNCDLLLEKIGPAKFMFEKFSQFENKNEEEFISTDLTKNEADFLRRQRSISEGTPSILIVSMARAACSGIIEQISEYSGNPRVELEAQPIPIEQDFAVGLLHDFVRGGSVSYFHPRGSNKNVNALQESGLTRFVLHLRDPRQCFLSNYYRMHAAKSWYDRRIYYNHLPLDYEMMSFEAQIDWHLENVYQHYWIGWIEEWLEVISNPDLGFEVLIVTYEIFLKNSDSYFMQIGDFFGLDWSEHAGAEMNVSGPGLKTEVGGRTDYWREKLTSNQVDRLQTKTPDGLLERFGWYR